MRIFPVLFRYRNKLHAHNKIKQFKYKWLIVSKKKVLYSDEKAVLESRGIAVYNPNDLLSEVVQRPKREDYIPEPPAPPEPMETLHFFGPDFAPLIGQAMPLAQNLTWTMTSDDLPQAVLDNRRELTTEDRQLVEQDILSSHLLDNWEVHVKDPRNFELPNKLEWNSYIYRIPMYRKNDLLTQSMVQTFDQISLDPLAMLARPHISQCSANSSFRYKGNLLQLALAVPLFVGALSPLKQVAPPTDAHLFIQPEHDDKTKRMILRKQISEDIGTDLQQPMPDTAPMEAFIGGKQLEQYSSLECKYVTSAPYVHPHTVYMHHNAELLDWHYHQLSALTLLQLYSTALTYALHAGIPINSSGHLSTPVVVQGVHSHLNLLQTAVFQLNTIGPHCRPITASNVTSHVNEKDALAGSHVRNMFYCRPFEKLYDECKHVVAKPTLSGVNTELIKILRALHEI